MWMTATQVILVAALAGTYRAAGPEERVIIALKAGSVECSRLAPAQRLAVEGPGKATLELWVDLPAKPYQPKPVELEIALDGAGKSHKLKPKRDKTARYDAGIDAAPSRKLKPIKVAIPAGSHELLVSLPEGRSGCWRLSGLERVAAAPEPAVAKAAPPVAPPLPPPAVVLAPPAPTETEAHAAAKPDLGDLALVPVPSRAGAPASTGATGGAMAGRAGAGATESGGSAGTPTGGKAASATVPGGEVEVIRAHGEPPAEVSEKVALPAGEETTAESAPLLRLTPKIGGLVATGGPLPSLFVGGEVELSLAGMGVPVDFSFAGMTTDLTVFLAGGYRWMVQQGTTAITGVRGFQTGNGEVSQFNDVACFDLGARFQLSIGETLQPFVGVSLAFDVTNSTFQAYSLEPVTKHSTTLGVGVAAGTWVRLGPGGLFFAAEYRHAEAKIGKFAKIGSSTLAEVGLQVGYGVAFGGWGL